VTLTIENEAPHVLWIITGSFVNIDKCGYRATLHFLYRIKIDLINGTIISLDLHPLEYMRRMFLVIIFNADFLLSRR